VHDALCIAYLIDSAVMSTERFHVAIETAGKLTLGQTVIDIHHRGTLEPNCDVALTADVKRFVSLMLETFV
jgi:inosine-uridine nucleoside N-ribohydrolase